MNHPNREDLVPYLFGEGTAETRRQLREHLGACPQCRAELQSWQRSLGRLNAWKLPASPRSAAAGGPALRWAFAGFVLLALGSAFLLGRFTFRPAADANVQARIAARLRAELTAGLTQLVHDEVAKAAQDMLATSREQTRSALAGYERTVNVRLEAEHIQRISDCLSLKKDVDT
ncbi:MAG: anti-sigma factor family protein, partial [Limisphaerales bacterium]